MTLIIVIKYFLQWGHLMNKLVFENIAIEAGNKKILKNVTLTIEKGDVLALVGPNGQGKSTLLNAFMGNAEYKITEGHIYLDDIDITNLSPDEKSRLGIFMAFQNPPEIEGVPSMDFFKLAINAHREKPISLFEYYTFWLHKFEEIQVLLKKLKIYLVVKKLELVYVRF